MTEPLSNEGHGLSLSTSPRPREARAADKPCQLHRAHSPRPSRTQGHHVHPVYLQNRLHGRILDNDLLWLCGTCHDNVHEWLGFLLGESRRPSPEPGRLAKAAAFASYLWYVKGLEAAGRPLPSGARPLEQARGESSAAP